MNTTETETKTNIETQPSKLWEEYVYVLTQYGMPVAAATLSSHPSGMGCLWNAIFKFIIRPLKHTTSTHVHTRMKKDNLQYSVFIIQKN